MKFKAFFTTAALSLAAFTFSPSAQALVSFGIKGGMNLNTLSIEGFDETGYHMGYMIGAGVDVGAGPLGLMAEVFWAQRGVKFNEGADIGFGSLPDDMTMKGNQIFVPIQARFSPAPLLRLSAGGFYSKGIGKTTTSIGGNSSTGGDNDDSDYGLVAGLGTALPLGVTTLTLEARYNYGLKEENDTKTRSIDFLVGVTF